MIFAGNFKTNHTRNSTELYINDLNQKIKDNPTGNDIYIFPPLMAIDHYETSANIGVQNAYPTQNGAFTGEIGLEQLEEFNIKTILIGHSERREYLQESQEIVSSKFNFFKEHNFTIIYCIGEPLAVREMGNDEVMKYLLAQFEGIDRSYENFIVAYEPIWAIGTGRSATVEEISSTHRSLKKIVNKPLLYGGSAKPANIQDIITIDGVDGVLVGNASLDIDSFYKMINI
ncbi:MAG: triose-phosphate isomerase [Sulfurovum sp.]|nr:triose-phosphate isomerase [Sulfurovaceae bacterium]